MLFNPNWQKAKPLTLEHLISWLEKKPADEPYCYFDEGRCLAAQYNAYIGRAYRPAPLWGWGFDSDMEHIAVSKPNTFGAALDRARKALAERK